VVNESKPELEQPLELEKRVQSLLQTRAEQLDGATRSRLTQARYAALGAIKEQSRMPKWYWLAPATAAATAMMVVFVTSQQPTTDPQVVAIEPVDEMEIVTAEDSLEFYRNVEFYAWLADMDEETLPDNEA
jgi:hypothetical protein